MSKVIDNIEDINAIDAKAPLASPVFTGTPTVNGVAFSGYSGFKNYIINGGFDVWQRGTEFTGIINGTYSADRWVVFGSVGDESYNVIRNAGVFKGGYGAEFTFTAASGTKSIIQFIENITRFKIGSKVTLSFEAFASQNVDIKPRIQGVRGLWAISTAEVVGDINTISLTPTKTRYLVTFTVPDWIGVVNSDWATLHDTKLAVKLNLDTGVGIGTMVTIGNVQLEEGSVATPFEQRPYGLELSLCQRYYQKFVQDKANGELYSHERFVSTNNQVLVSKTISFKVPMRTTPTVTIPRVYSQSTDYDTGWGVYQSGLNNGIGGICIYKSITAYSGNILAFDAIADAEL